MNGIAGLSAATKTMPNAAKRPGGYSGVESHVLLEFMFQMFPGEEELEEPNLLLCKPSLKIGKSITIALIVTAA